MRKIFIIIFIILGFKALAQNPEIKNEMPAIIGPSPNVAALMKFEEIPVSNYTGVPDVSIPLFSSPTLSKDIDLNIALKYHPASVAANEVATDVGLGWSLFAGGTISRTVRGLPDEIYSIPVGVETYAGDPYGKIGIYRTNLTHHPNHYYYFNENFTNAEKDQYVINTITPQDSLKVNRFLMETKDLAKYDTEHDLWQFNFMGHTGRFYIKLNQTTQKLEVIPLEDYRVKIEYNYNLGDVNNLNTYKPISFTIYDVKGCKYIFDVIETTFNKTASEQSFGASSTSYSETYEKPSISSIHLSKIFDSNNEILLEFKYSDINEYSEVKISRSITRNFFLQSFMDYYAIVEQYNCNGEFKPIILESTLISNNKVRKLEEINIKNIGSVYFSYNFQRTDSNIGMQNNAFALSNLMIKDLNENIVKSFNFEFEFSIIPDNFYGAKSLKRLILNKISEVTQNENKKHSFEYYDQVYHGNSVGIDYWGYFNLMPFCAVDNHVRRSPSPEFCTRDLLQKIIYPTGGCAIFDFGANTYSYQGDTAIEDFFQDDQNIQQTDSNNYTFNTTNDTLYLGVLSNNYKKLVFGPSIVHEDISIATRTFLLMKKINNNWVPAGKTLFCSSSNCCIEFYPENGVEYKVEYKNLDIGYTGNETLSISYYTPILSKQYLQGGGNRINKIGYFDKDVDKNYFVYGTLTDSPSKLIYYDYRLPNNPNKSSGSLVYTKPTFITEKGFSVKTACNPTHPLIQIPFFYTSETSQNVYASLKSHGADVGYKNVSVSQSNFGKTDFVYTSPIDFPEDIIINPLFDHIPSKNIDYKRGQIISETILNNQDKITLQIINDYEFIGFEEQTGLRLLKSYFDSNYQGLSFEFSFVNLKNKFDDEIDYWGVGISLWGNATPFIRSKINFHNGNPISQRNIFIRPIIEAYGWAKLKSKTTQSYFYPTGSTTPNIVQIDETYDYNPINKKISESTVTNSFGEIMKTKYFYLTTVDTPNSKNNISTIERIETYKNNDLLSTSKIEYSTAFAGNVSYLPQTIQTSKGSQALGTRVKYNAYDEFGHPLELQQENGTVVSYIWGYNKTQPIAKIENATYASVQSYVANLQTLSNGTNEANLITALNALRTALPNAMITTYTYKPLVGISTVTDPKGDTQIYIYDAFNRLQLVKDAQDNILSENQYHYRTQN